MALVVHAANIGDRDGAAQLVERAPEKAPGLRHVWVDSGYTGTGVRHLQRPGWTVEVVRRNAERNRAWRTDQMPLFTAVRGFELVRWRWIVERTFGWLGRYRRMSKDYEASTWASEAWIWIALLRNLTRRLAS